MGSSVLSLLVCGRFCLFRSRGGGFAARGLFRRLRPCGSGAGARVASTTDQGVAPITLALGAGSRETVDKLLDAGAKVDPASPRFEEELAAALAMDSDVFLAAALKEGMSADRQTAKGWSALELALIELHPTIAPRDPEEGDYADGTVAIVGQDGLPTFDANALDVKPQVISAVPPSYPYELRKQGASGEVVVDFVVSADGSVREVEVRSATAPAFATSAGLATSRHGV